MKKKSKKLVKSVLLAAVLSLFGTKSASAEPIAVNNDMDGTRSEDEVGSMKKSVFKNVLAKVTKSGNVIGINNHRSHTSHRSHSSHRSSNTGHASHYSSTPSTTTTTSSTTTRSTSSSSSSTSSRNNNTSTTNSFKTIEEDNTIYLVTTEEAQFPGGADSLAAFIKRNLQYPIQAKENNISGKAYVSFVVEKDGSLTDVKVAAEIGGGCGNEAVRIVKLMPKWIPAKQYGANVRCQMVIPIEFAL